MNEDLQWTTDLKSEFLDWILSEITPDPTKELVKRFIEIRQLKQGWEIIQVSSPEYGLYYLAGYKMRPNEKIYSVKRLSDNSVWTIGDQFIANAGCPLTIKEFKVSGQGMEVWSKEYGYWMINNIRELPSFTTEDGACVHENDKVWLLSTDGWHFVSANAPSSPFRGDKGQFKYFSTKEAAEDYVFNNKPCLSFGEVIECDKKSTSLADFRNKIKSIAQFKTSSK